MATQSQHCASTRRQNEPDDAIAGLAATVALVARTGAAPDSGAVAGSLALAGALTGALAGAGRGLRTRGCVHAAASASAITHTRREAWPGPGRLAIESDRSMAPNVPRSGRRPTRRRGARP